MTFLSEALTIVMKAVVFYILRLVELDDFIVF